MKLTIERAALLKTLAHVQSVVERRNTIPILSNVLIDATDGTLSLTATDMDLTIVDAVPVEVVEPGATTAPAHTLYDIVRKLPEGAQIEASTGGDAGQIRIEAGRSVFTLATLPKEDFPTAGAVDLPHEFALQPGELRHLIDRTRFAISTEETRYYLNGIYLHAADSDGVKVLRAVATDGHRLAVCSRPAELRMESPQKLIVPRKGILELVRLLDDGEDPVSLTLGASHIRAHTGDFTFTSKLVDGKFPDYERVVPRGGDKVFIADRAELRQVLSRTAILSNEKYRGVRLNLEEGNLRVMANNPEQEEAEENIAIEYSGGPLEIGFNVGYLVDVLNALDEDRVQMTLADSNSSALMEEPGGGDALYVVMPMRL